MLNEQESFDELSTGSMVSGLSVKGNPLKADGTIASTIYYTLDKQARVSVRMYTANGNLVQTILAPTVQLAGREAVAWYGKDDSGEVVAEGVYTYKITAVDAVTGATSEGAGTITVDRMAPEISNVELTPHPFDPKAGTNFTIKYNLNEDAVVTVDIYNSANVLVRTIAKTVPNKAGANSVTWNGQNTAGLTVQNGWYSYRMLVTDQVGFSRRHSGNFHVAEKFTAGVKFLAAGYDHALVLKEDGTVWAWGYNGSGQLGDGTTTTRKSSPVKVQGLSDVVAIAANLFYSLALKSDGTVWLWGNDQFSQRFVTETVRVPKMVPVLTDIKAIAAGENHMLALKSDGTVWAWGREYYGEVGGGLHLVWYPTPVMVPELSNVTKIGAGFRISYALKSDKSLLAWGLRVSETPSMVPAMDNVIDFAVGYSHVLALKANGAVFAWGVNAYGQLGDGTTKDSIYSSVQISGLTNVGKLAYGGRSMHSGAIRSDGTLLTWGKNAYGELGIVANPLKKHPIPTQVPNIKNVISYASGYEFSLVLLSDGTLLSTGRNNQGQLGNGTFNDSNAFQPISNFKLFTGPVVSNLSVKGNPLKANGTIASTIYYTLDKQSYVSVHVYATNGNLVYTAQTPTLQSAGRKAIAWYGKNDSGALVPEGVYTYKIAATDAVTGATGETAGTITVDRMAPVISNLEVSPAPFEPKSGIDLTIKYSLNEDATVTVDIYNSANELVRTIAKVVPNKAGVNVITWDGKDNAGVIVPDGPYTSRMLVTDQAGFSRKKTSGFTVYGSSSTLSGVKD